MFDRREEPSGWLARFQRWLDSWSVGQSVAYPTASEDSEELLRHAEEQLREVYARNRERAVTAITVRNNLQQMVAELSHKAQTLEARTREAEGQGELSLAENLRAEREQCLETLETTRQRLAEAEEAAEAIKVLLKSQEELVRRKTAEALAIRAQWRLARVEQAMGRRGGGEGYPGDYFDRSESAPLPDPETCRIQLIEAMQARDELRRMVEEAARHLAELQVKVDFARHKGNEPLERQLLREIEQGEAGLEAARLALDRAEAVVGRIGQALRGVPYEPLPGEFADPGEWADSARAEGWAEGWAEAWGEEPERRANSLRNALLLAAALIALFFLALALMRL